MIDVAPQRPSQDGVPCPLFARITMDENPYETIIPEIHRGPAVFFADKVRVDGTPGWIVRRNADLRKIYMDTESFHKKGFTRTAAVIGESWDVIPTELDPPRHTAFRAALNPIFSPTRMMKMDVRVRDRAREIIEGFRRRGSCEFVRDFAVQFPISIFLDMMGLPQEDMAQFLEWESALLHSNDMEVRISGIRAIKTMLLETIAARKRNPGDDLISTVLTLEVDGRKWTDEEVFGHCYNLYLGGLDTVTSTLSLHFRHLADTPDDQETMRTNTPEQNVVAVEELLRAYASVQTARICSKPYEIGGQTFQPGDFVAMSTVLAGRDPEAYDEPNQVRLDRRPAHLSLGLGPHRCLGQHLARRELQIAIEQFVKVLPNFRIEPGYRVKYFMGNVFHVPELPLSWS